MSKRRYLEDEDYEGSEKPIIRRLPPKKYRRTRGTFNINPAMPRQISLRPSINEKKAITTSLSPGQVNSSGLFTLLCCPQLGTDINHRIGRKITITDFYVRGSVQLEAAAGPAGNVNVPTQLVRMILLVDNQPNGAAPTVLDLLTGSAPQCHLNLNNRDRFKILVDKQWPFDAYHRDNINNFSTWGRTMHAIKKFKKLNIETVFNGINGGTIADITTGALWLFWIGGVAAGTNTDVNTWSECRVKYIDS